MAYQPIIWGYQDSSGRQSESDGGRLINLFPVEAPSPETAKIPATLYGTPGAATWKNVPISGDVMVDRALTLGFDLDPGNTMPRGAWSDGRTIWVGNGDDAPRSVFYGYVFSTGVINVTQSFFSNNLAGQHIIDITGWEGMIDDPDNPGTDIQAKILWAAYTNNAWILAYNLLDTSTMGARPRVTAWDIRRPAGSSPIVAIWVEGDVLWVMDSTELVTPNQIPGTTGGTLPDPFRFPSQGLIRTPRGGASLADGEVAIVDEGVRELYGTQVGVGGRDTASDFDFKSVYSGISAAHGFHHDGDIAWRIDTDLQRMYALRASDKRGIDDRQLALPSDGDSSYSTSYRNAQFVVHKVGSTTQIRTFHRDTGAEGVALNPGAVGNAQGVFVNGDGLWLADRATSKILAYRFSSVGAHDPARNFTLPGTRGDPAGIWQSGDSVYVGDSADGVIGAYFAADGSQDTIKDFSVPNADQGFSHISGDARHFFVLRGDNIVPYLQDGMSRSNLNAINLDAANANPRGLHTNSTHAFVLDGTARKIFAYRWSTQRFGVRNTALDIDTENIVSGLSEPNGIGGAGGRIWISGESPHGKLYEVQQASNGALSRKTSNVADSPDFPRQIIDFTVYQSGGTTYALIADDRSIYRSTLSGNSWSPWTVFSNAVREPRSIATDGTYAYAESDIAGSSDTKIVRFPLSNPGSLDSWELLLPSGYNHGSSLFIYQGIMWVADNRNKEVTAFDIATRQQQSDLSVNHPATRPQGIWGDGTYLYTAENNRSGNDGMIFGFRMSGGVRDPGRDINLTAAASNPYGLWGNATTFYVGNRGSAPMMVAYHATQKIEVSSKSFPLATGNTEPLALAGDNDGIYCVDEDLTVYWYGLRGQGIVRNAAGDITLHADNGEVAGIWLAESGSEKVMFAVNSRPGGIFAYNAEGSKERIERLTFELDQENIDNIPTGLFGNATHLWVGAELNGYVYAYLRGSGNARGQICAFIGANASPRGVWASADNYYIPDEATRHLYIYDQDTCQLALSGQTQAETSSAVWLGLIAIESPINGNHLFGVAQDHYFHYCPGPPHNDGETITVTGQFTTYAEEQLQGPTKLATDNRYVFIVTPISIKIYDLVERALLVLDNADADADPDADPDAATVALPRASNLSDILRDEEWVSTAWVDGYFILGTRAGEVFHSNLRSLEFSQLDFARTEAYPDELVSIEVYNRQLVLFGSQSIEQWYNRGDLTTVFRRNFSLAANVGAASASSIAVDIYGIYFLGTNGIVYLYQGTSALRRMSTSAIEEPIRKSDVSKASAYIYTEEGQRFYVLTLDTGGTKRVFALHLDTQLWHERTISDIVAFAEFEGVRIASRADGLHEMSVNTGSDGGTAVVRSATLPATQAARHRYNVSALEIEVPFRAGGAAGDTVELDWSFDGGKTRAVSPLSYNLGSSTSTRFKWLRLGGGSRTRNFRLTTRATRPINILGAYIDIDVLEQ